MMEKWNDGIGQEKGERNIGMMEDWNDGIGQEVGERREEREYRRKNEDKEADSSLLHYSITPVSLMAVMLGS